MRTHKFINDPKELLKQGVAVIDSTSDSKYIHRVVMVNLLLSGSISSLQLSKLSHIPQRTLNLWLTIADEQGFERLKAVRQTGRPTKLGGNELAIIKDAISKDPQLNGFNVWDGPSLSQFISDNFAIQMGVRQCQRLFHKLGFSLVRPQTFPSKDEPNEESRSDFKKN